MRKRITEMERMERMTRMQKGSGMILMILRKDRKQEMANLGISMTGLQKYFLHLVLTGAKLMGWTSLKKHYTLFFSNYFLDWKKYRTTKKYHLHRPASFSRTEAYHYILNWWLHRHWRRRTG